jgi:chromosome segregation ATPase
MWQKMVEMVGCRVKEYEQKLTEERAELATTKEQLSRAQAQEASLVHQNARMSMELVASEKREKKLAEQVSELEKRISAETTRFSRAEEEWSGQKEKDKREVEAVQKELNEKTKVLREYQEKLSKMTEKVQRLTKGLAIEKASAEQLQKSGSERSNQQTAENRKLALEISKLKVYKISQPSL